MTRDESVALFLQGKEAWNAWAQARLAERKALEEAGDWQAEEDIRPLAWAEVRLAERKALEEAGDWQAEKDIRGLVPKNAKTRAWFEAARADFRFCLFLTGAVENEEKEAETKAELEKLAAKVGRSVKTISVEGAGTDFSDFIFPGNAFFGSAPFSATFYAPAAFSGDAFFDSATFGGTASFHRAAFSGRAIFGSAAFSGEAFFFRAAFSGIAFFERAAFSGRAIFGRAAFSGDAIFARAAFSGDAIFASAAFRNSTAFPEAIFGEEANFAGIKVERDFTMTGARFAQVPAFNQADFAQAPDLDDVRFPLPGFWRRGKPELIARYRAIRRMAIQGADYEREQMAFKGEIRSKRRTEHKWHHAALWFGLLYDALSDFGRSLWRPFVAWLACIGIFTVYFLGQSPQMETKRNELSQGGVIEQLISYPIAAFDAFSSRPHPQCFSEEAEKDKPKKRLIVDDKGNGFSSLVEQVRETTNLINEALSIAYHNAVIILDSSGDSAHRAFGCLYGVERYGGNPVAFVPRSVAIASGVQKLLSALFIFLFILAVRNMLKVK